MLDLAGILISTLLILYVLIQAVLQDARRPWFEVAEQGTKLGPENAELDRTVPPWRRPRR